MIKMNQQEKYAFLLAQGIDVNESEVSEALNILSNYIKKNQDNDDRYLSSLSEVFNSYDGIYKP